MGTDPADPSPHDCRSQTRRGLTDAAPAGRPWSCGQSHAARRHQSLSGAEPAWRTSLVRHLESDPLRAENPTESRPQGLGISEVTRASRLKAVSLATALSPSWRFLPGSRPHGSGPFHGNQPRVVRQGRWARPVAAKIEPCLSASLCHTECQQRSEPYCGVGGRHGCTFSFGWKVVPIQDVE